MRRALGRGLAHLISEEFRGEPTEAPVQLIRSNPFQPRKTFSQQEIDDLAESIKTYGILSPLLVRPSADGGYELIAGERRLRAAIQAGLEKAPIRVQSTTDRESLEIALIENLQREDLDPMEAAEAYRRLSEEFELTQEEISKRVGKSRVAIANLLRLLKLPEPIRDALRSGSITEGHARALLSLPTPPQQLAAFKVVLEKGLNVRETEKLGQLKSPAQKRPPAKPTKQEPHFAALARELEEALGAPVAIEQKGDSGKITISFYSVEDLTRISEIIISHSS